jgi:carboxypeptidase family protein
MHMNNTRKKRIRALSLVGNQSEHSLVAKACAAAIIALVMTCGVWVCAAAQSESGSAAIEGTVTDSNSSALSGATVTIRNQDTGYSRTIVTDSNGRFSAGVMPVGTYVIKAVATGFAEARVEGAQLTVGMRKTINLTLQPPTTKEGGVIVSAGSENLDREEMGSGASIGLRYIGDLPLRGRNFPEFVKLTPGIVQESDRWGLVVSGQRSINSNVAIDGADFNDALQGNQRGGNDAVFFFPQTAVREFQVIRSGATVEVGRTNAGFVNVVTKSGGNGFHGEAFFLNRNPELTSPNAFDRSLDNKQNHFGGSIGGPIKRDRAFFFIGVEQNFLQVPFFVKFKPQPAGTVIPSELASLEGEHDGTNNPTAVFARSDITLSNRDSLNVFYTMSRVNGDNFNTELTPDNAQTTNYTRKGSSQAVKVGLTSVFNPNLLNEVRGQYANDNRDESPTVNSPLIAIAGFGNVGGDAARPRLFDAARYEATDNLSVNRGPHQFRFGADVNVNQLSQSRINNIQGRYDFLSLSDYVIKKIDRYRQTMAASSTDDFIFEGAQKEFALYAQGKLSLHRDLMLTAGVRWEGQWNPQPQRPNPTLIETQRIPNDLAQWQPRLGLAWNVAGTGNTVVRVSAGIYDARTPGTLMQRVTTENGVSTLFVDTKTDKNVFNFLHFPDMLTSVPPGIKLALPSVVGFQQEFRNPRSFQASTDVERVIGRNTVVSVGYIHNSTWNLQRRVDRNLFAPTIDATGMPIFPKDRPNKNISRFVVNESSAHSRYDGMVLSATRRFANRFSLQANYTLARALDDDSNERTFNRETALNPFDFTLDRSYSQQDVRHTFSLTGLTDLPGGFTFSSILLTHSGLPFTPVINVDTQNDGNDVNDRAIINGHVAGRNSMRQPSFFNLDMRLLKAFKLGETKHVDVIAEGFNICRNSNKYFGPDSVSEFGTVAKPSPTAGQPLFSPSTARFGGPRQVELGVRFVF